MPTIAEFNQIPSLVRLSHYGELDAGELKALMALVTSSRRVSKGSYLYHEGERSPGAYLVLKGWTASSMSNGEGKRQLLKVHLAGDVIGWPGLPFVAAPDTVTALTPVIVGRIDLKALGGLFQKHARLAAVMFMVSHEERLLLMDRLFMVGRQDAIGRVSGLILQLHSRIVQQSPDTGDTIELPLTQKDCADLLGLTTIHMNRTLAEMRRRHILTWSRSQIVLHDKVAMRRLSGVPERTLIKTHAWLPDRV